MPIINGCKYSCEPCIRGHRASSCAHSDRILIEVRKPGRPLESCGHSFNSCQCGKIAELLAVGPVPQSQAYLTPEQEKQDVSPIQSPPVPKPSKPKQRRRSSSKVNKRRSKPAGSIPTLASMDRGLGEDEPQHQHHDPNCQNAQPAPYATQSPYGSSVSYSQQISYSQPGLSPYPAARGGHYVSGMQTGYIHAANCVSRAENVAVASGPNLSYSGQQAITSQYIVASPESTWEGQPPRES